MKNYSVDVVRFRVLREEVRADVMKVDRPEAAYKLALALIPDDAREHFGMFMLNTQNRLVAYHEVSQGTLSASIVHPREVFGPALRLLGVAAVVLVHNHPSGDPEPSAEDVQLTRRLVKAGSLVEVPVVDHVILGDGSGRYVSMAERRLLS